MPRITEHSGTVLTEALAKRIEIEWERGDIGRVLFYFAEDTSVNGVFLRSLPSRTVVMKLEDLLSQVVTIEVAPGVTEQLPVVKVLLAFKAMTDVAWDLPPPQLTTVPPVTEESTSGPA